MSRRAFPTIKHALSGGRSTIATRSVTYMPRPGDGTPRPVTMIPGDGVGPLVTGAVEQVMEAMHAPVYFEKYDIHGDMKSVPQEVIDSIKKNKVCLKGGLKTPVGGGVSSLNVVLRKELDLYASLVHCFNLQGLPTRHENVDIVVIRENTEGVVPGVVESLKVITKFCSERIAKYAFEYAYLNNRKVTAVHKANIMKLADGLFLESCREVASKYPSIQYNEMIVDNCSMQLVSKPEQFDGMVTPNLYGNLVANTAAGIAGGTGVMPGGNVGSDTEGLKLLVSAGPHAQKAVGIWLFLSAAWVFSMVLLGGVTRLTRSGLSMTDWKFTGSLPPLSTDEWLIEFDKYKQSPEYKRINKGMNLDDFKFIYWMEYAHRMWGRALGIMFALPFSYFLRKGYITPQLGLRLCGLFSLGAGQGLIGWWMVKSGLEEPISEYAEPRVSPYRLAAHLTSAFVIYTGLFWTALSVVMPEPPSESLAWVQGAAKVKRLALPVSVLVGITAVSGAFVAGNDAGRAFNTFPKMGDAWVPEDVFKMKPLIRNFFENTSTVQLDHRILATATLFSIGGLWWSTRKFDINPAIRSLLGSTAGMAVLQVTLGISTLLSYVPVSLGTAHQAGALTLLTLMILLNHTLRRPSLHLLKTLPSVVKTV